MDFLKTAQMIIPEISGLAMTVYKDEEQMLADFEKTFCFLPEIQPLYTVKGLLSFFSHDRKEKNRIYEITDALDTHAILMDTEQGSIVLGPYVTDSWRETVAKELLAGCGLQADMLAAYKIYRCSLPVAVQYKTENIAALILKNLEGDVNLEPVRLDLTAQKAGGFQLHAPEVYSEYEQTEQRYAGEFQIMDAVRQGDSAKALKLLYADLSQDAGNHFFLSKDIGIRFMSNSMGDKIAGAFAIRVLVRHAALQAGLTTIFVDALSQEYAQKMHHAKDEVKLHKLMVQYITAFCKAVKENRENQYSPYIKRSVQYIELHLSQQVRVEKLCEMNQITQQYFTHMFKKETGKTVKQYIMCLRCERAAELLENSSLPVQEISQYVGYEDISYFGRVFKSLYGIPPQEYRKQKIMQANTSLKS